MKKLNKYIIILIFIFLITLILTQRAESVSKTNENVINEQTLKQELFFLKMQNMALRKELTKAQDLKNVLDESNYIGEFTITHYTAGVESTGKTPEHPLYGITRSGTKVKEGQTVAADWSVLPKNSVVYIEGYGIRVVEDTGSAINGNDIDIYISDLETARNLGVKQAKVYVLEYGGES